MCKDCVSPKIAHNFLYYKIPLGANNLWLKISILTLLPLTLQIVLFYVTFCFSDFYLFLNLFMMNSSNFTFT